MHILYITLLSELAVENYLLMNRWCKVEETVVDVFGGNRGRRPRIAILGKEALLRLKKVVTRIYSTC